MILTVALGIGLLALMTYIGLRMEAWYRACLSHYGLARPKRGVVYCSTFAPLLVAAICMAYLLQLLASSMAAATLTAELARAMPFAPAISAVVLLKTLASSWALLHRRHLTLMQPAAWTARGIIAGFLLFVLAVGSAFFLAFAARLAIPAELFRAAQAHGVLPAAPWVAAFGNTVLLVGGMTGVVCAFHILSKLADAALRLHLAPRATPEPAAP